MKTSKDFEEFFALLNDHDVRYMVVGGYAFAVHAEPRYTKDLDIFFETSKDNAQKIIRVLTDFGFESLNITIQDLITPEQIIQLGNPPLRIDLINGIEGVTFIEAWPNRLQSKYGNEDIFIIGKQELIKNKKTSGREQDLLDVKRLSE